MAKTTLKSIILNGERIPMRSSSSREISPAYDCDVKAAYDCDFNQTNLKVEKRSDLIIHNGYRL